MPKSCCAYNCTEIFVKNSAISFHSFPKDPLRRKLWTRNLRRENFVPKDRSTWICSKHFEEECFDREKFGGRWLKSTAVPTIFNFPQPMKIDQVWSIQQKQPERISRGPPKKIYSSPKEQEINGCAKENSVGSKEINEYVEETPVGCKEMKVKKSRFAYIGDFKDDDDSLSPTMMKKRWLIAKAVIQRQKKKLEAMYKKNARLNKKVANLSNMLKELKKQKNYISENAKDT